MGPRPSVQALSVAAIVGIWLVTGCGGRSSRAAGDDNGQSKAGGSSPTAGTTSDAGESAIGGTTSDAGAPATGGVPPTGGSASGGASSGGAGVAANCGYSPPETTPQPPECQGIQRGRLCPLEGIQCLELPCGIADTGRRQCNCTSVWECTSCHTDSPISIPSEVLACPSGVADGVSCNAEGLLCGPEVSGEYCACYVNPDGCLVWDCDDLPTCGASWCF